MNFSLSTAVFEVLGSKEKSPIYEVISKFGEEKNLTNIEECYYPEVSVFVESDKYFVIDSI